MVQCGSRSILKQCSQDEYADLISDKKYELLDMNLASVTMRLGQVRMVKKAQYHHTNLNKNRTTRCTF